MAIEEMKGKQYYYQLKADFALDLIEAMKRSNMMSACKKSLEDAFKTHPLNLKRKAPCLKPWKC